MFQLNGKAIDIKQDLTIGEGDEAITYPAAELAKPEVREALGIVEIASDPRPDDRYYWVTDNGDGTYATEPKSVEMLKAIKSAEIAAARYAVEVAGVVLPGGEKIKTDRESQATIGNALLRTSRKPDALIDWKGDNGWIKIGREQIEVISDAVGDHVQACFTAERQKQEALEALDDAASIIAFDTSIVLGAA